MKYFAQSRCKEYLGRLLVYLAKLDRSASFWLNTYIYQSIVSLIGTKHEPCQAMGMICLAEHTLSQALYHLEILARYFRNRLKSAKYCRQVPR
jgi:hypothetical protein